MKKRSGLIQELLAQATKEIEKMSPEQKLELKKGIQESFDKRAKELEAERKGLPPHPNEYSPLHAALATYFIEDVRTSSYRELEKRFVLMMKNKKDAGISLNAEEEGLLNRILFCSKCGTKNPNGSAYCFNCGQKLHLRTVLLGSL